MRVATAVVLPAIIGGGAVLANVAFISLLSLPILLGGWAGCMGLALSARHEQRSRLKQFGVTLLVAIGLLLLLHVCVNLAWYGGRCGARHGTAQPAELLVWHLAGVGPAFLISWGQKLLANFNRAAWGRRLFYWFTYCPVSALAGALLARCGLAPGN